MSKKANIKDEKEKEKETEKEQETDEVKEEEAMPPEKDSMQEEIEKKDKEIENLKNQLMRNMAEYDNYRKRTSRERIELEPEITAKTASEFLTVADNLERALSIECADENFKKGVQMIYDSFVETLNKLGVETIPTEGEFNPSMHQAVQQVPAEEGQESGTIASTFQKGYKLGDRILRFAMVAVYA